MKTTISTYNSVDKSYFYKATNVLNEQFKENKNEKIASLVEEDDFNELIQMLEEKRKRKRQKDDFEM